MTRTLPALRSGSKIPPLDSLTVGAWEALVEKVAGFYLAPFSAVMTFDEEGPCVYAVWNRDPPRREELIRSVHKSVTEPDLFTKPFLFAPLLNDEGETYALLIVSVSGTNEPNSKDIAALALFANQAEAIRRENDLRSALMLAQRQLSIQIQEAADAKFQHREFLSTLSHEMRTPMNSISGLCELIADQELSSRQAQLVQNLASASRSIIETLDVLLTHSKTESESNLFLPTFFDLRAFLNETLSPFRILSEAGGIEFTSHIELDPQVFCRGDKVRLRQVLTNLMSNAMKFTGRGGRIRFEVEIESENDPASETASGLVLLAEPDKVHRFAFRIIDTGIGIRSEDHPRLFHPYHQVSGDLSKGGSGLGLSICRKIIEGMNGRIGFVSEFGRGSTFWFRLPLPIADRNIPDKPRPRFLSAHSQYYREGTVLLLEDNAISSAVTEAFLESAGLNVRAASTLDAAVALLDTQFYDLVLVDLHLGDTPPDHLLQQLRERTSAPLIAISGSPLAKADLPSPLDDALQKPFSRDDFLNTIRRWLLDTNEKAMRVAEWTGSLSMLEEQCGADFLEDTIGRFVDRHPGDLQRLKTYLRDRHWDKLELAAHSMKSTLATFGLMHLARLCAEIESIAMEPKADREILAMLVEAFRVDSRKTYQFLIQHVHTEYHTSGRVS